MDNADEYLVDNTYNFSCDSGYTLTGNGTGYCDESGEWIKITGGCDIEVCGEAPNVKNGKNWEDAGLVYTFGEELVYDCFEG